MSWKKVLEGVIKAAPSLLYMGATYEGIRSQRKAADAAMRQQEEALKAQRLSLEDQRRSLAEIQAESAKAREAAEAQRKAEEKKLTEVKTEAKQERLEEDVARIKRRRGRKSLVTGQKGGLGFFDQYFNA